jgi:DNA-directed RNA polymerase subunit RPC12/RpoP
MNLIEFIEVYPDEASWRAKFKEYRDRVGVACPKCGSKAHYWKRDKGSYECTSARRFSAGCSWPA